MKVFRVRVGCSWRHDLALAGSLVRKANAVFQSLICGSVSFSSGRTLENDDADDANAATRELQMTLCISRRHFPIQLRVWNYNRPNCETEGVKDLLVALNGQDVWRGQVPKVCLPAARIPAL